MENLLFTVCGHEVYINITSGTNQDKKLSWLKEHISAELVECGKSKAIISTLDMDDKDNYIISTYIDADLEKLSSNKKDKIKEDLSIEVAKMLLEEVDAGHLKPKTHTREDLFVAIQGTSYDEISL